MLSFVVTTLISILGFIKEPTNMMAMVVNDSLGLWVSRTY